VGWVRRRKGWGGLEGASGVVEARLAWKYPGTSRSYNFELCCRQGSEELPICSMSMNNSQKQSLTRSSEFQYIHIGPTLHLGTICFLEVLFKRILNPSRGCKRDSMMNLKMYSDYTNALQ